jgi:hypothetical protein
MASEAEKESGKSSWTDFLRIPLMIGYGWLFFARLTPIWVATVITAFLTLMSASLYYIITRYEDTTTTPYERLTAHRKMAVELNAELQRRAAKKQD